MYMYTHIDDNQLRKTIVDQQRKELLEEGLHTDFTIVCGDANGKEVFRIHRAILASRSPYFKGMLTNENFVETRTGVMRIDEFGAEIIRPLLAFIYAGERPKDLPVDQMMEVLRAAAIYEVDELKTICGQKLAGMFSAENALDLLVFAELQRAKGLKLAAINFINGCNRSKIVDDGFHWKEFARNNPQLVEELYKGLCSQME